jgi:hypothetical protein
MSDLQNSVQGKASTATENRPNERLDSSLITKFTERLLDVVATLYLGVLQGV